MSGKPEIISMACLSETVVATSIPLNLVRYENGRNVGQAYQRHCIESWFRAGFRVLSLNFPDEILELAPRYPKVHFTAINRDNSAILGRKTPLIADLLAALASQNEDIVGLINADIFLEAKDWTNYIKAAVRGAMLVSHRYDVTACSNGNSRIPYTLGYDVVFLERKEIWTEIGQSFAIGIPWWDYLLPIVFRLRGLRVNLLTSPIAFHLQHSTNYNMPIWRYMANEFAEFVVDSSTVSSGFIAPDLFPVISLCREVLAEPAIFEDVRRSALERVSGKLLASTRYLPVLSRLAGRERGQDARRIRLAKACIAAISGSNMITNATRYAAASAAGQDRPAVDF
jgi:hypothetical protein